MKRLTLPEARQRCRAAASLLLLAGGTLLVGCDDPRSPTAISARLSTSATAPTYSGWSPAEGSTLPEDPVLEYTVSSTDNIDASSYRFTVNGSDWRSNAAQPTLSSDGKSMRFWSNVVNLPTGQPMTFWVRYCTTGGVCTEKTMGYNGAPTGVGEKVTDNSSTSTASAPAYANWLPTEGSTLPQDPVLEYTVSSTERLDPVAYRFTVNGSDWRSNAAQPTLSSDGKSMRFWSNVVNLPTGQPMTFWVRYCTTGGVCTEKTMGYNGAPTGVGEKITDFGTPQSRGAESYGVVITDGYHRESGTDYTEAAFDAAQASGAGWVRLTAYWYVLQPETAEFSAAALDHLDSQIQAATANNRNLKVMLSIEGTPKWVQGCTLYEEGAFKGAYILDKDGNYIIDEKGDTATVPCGDSRYPPHGGYYDYWASFLKSLGERYAGKVHAWGIWNEPNAGFFLVQRDSSKIDQYKKFLWYGVAELRDLSGGKIVAPDLAQGDNTQLWVKSIMETEAHRVDIIGLHQYNYALCTEKDVLAIKRVAPGRPVWVSEAGYDGTDAAVQVRQLAGILDEMQDSTAQNDCGHHWATDIAAVNEDADWDVTFVYHAYEKNEAYPTTRLVDATGPSTYTPREAFTCLKYYTSRGVTERPANCVRTAEH